MRIRSFLAIIMGPAMLVLTFSCRSGTTKNSRKTSHGAEAKSNSGSTIYVDRVPNRQVLQQDSTNSSQNSFFSFRIGFEDSAVLNEKQRQDWGKYFNYEMEKNWVLLVNGDSTFPVFFQPLIKRIAKLDEGIIVFEAAKGSNPDTVIYKNRFDKRKEIFILKNE